jgi:hypothetical protein
MPKTPSKKIAFEMPARQALLVLDWLGDAIAATGSDDHAYKPIQELQRQLQSALRVEIGTTDLQEGLLKTRAPRKARASGSILSKGQASKKRGRKSGASSELGSWSSR